MKHARVIVNPVAGGGRAARDWRRLAAELRAGGIDADVAFTREPGDGIALAEQAARAGCDLVIPFGGDGTAHEVANGLLKVPAAPPLAPVQAGSVNALAHCLGFPRRSSEQVAFLGRAQPARLDVGWAEYEGPRGRERRAFVLLASLGWSAQLVGRAQAYRRLGHAGGYIAAGLASWWGLRAGCATLTRDRVAWEGMVSDVLLVNAPITASGIRLAPGADATDGALDSIVTGAASRLELGRLGAGLTNGSHVRRPSVQYGRVRELSVDPEIPMPLQLDGEIVGRTPVTFRVQPGALDVLAGELRRG